WSGAATCGPPWGWMRKNPPIPRSWRKRSTGKSGRTCPRLPGLGSADSEWITRSCARWRPVVSRSWSCSWRRSVSRPIRQRTGSTKSASCCRTEDVRPEMTKARPVRGGPVPPALRLRNQLVVAADRVMRRADELVIGDGSLIVAPHSGTRQDRATYLDAQCVGLALISGPALEVVPTVSRLTRVLLPDQIHDVRDRGGVQQLRDLLREGDRHPGDGQLVRPSLASADGLAPDYPAVQCIRINSKRSTDAGQHGH